MSVSHAGFALRAAIGRKNIVMDILASRGEDLPMTVRDAVLARAARVSGPAGWPFARALRTVNPDELREESEWTPM